MARINGRETAKSEIMQKAGNMSQLCFAERVILNQGKAAGMKAIELNNGGGLSMRILEDRALDIFYLAYKGINLGFVTKPGLVSPDLYDASGTEFLRTFQGGFLYTCGLSNVGPACEDDNGFNPFHGRIGNTPAETVRTGSYWQGDGYFLEVYGETREAALYGENLVLKRRISTKLGSKSFSIEDVIENQGFENRQVMLLYHMNMGYPLLDSSTKLYLPVTKTEPRSEGERSGLEEYSSFCDPADGKEEQALYHYLKSGSGGKTCICIYNHGNGVGVGFRYSLNELPCLTQWKSMKTGDYVVGIEPGNCHPDGRKASREKGESDTLKAGESRRYGLSFEIIDGDCELDGMLSEFGSFNG